MRELIHQELEKVQNPKHRGDLYQQAGESLARILHKPHFRIRARLIPVLRALELPSSVSLPLSAVREAGYEPQEENATL